MIRAGCVSRVMEATGAGNALAGVGYCFRRAVERSIPHAIETVDYTNFTLAMALHAAALGVPFMPTYAALGSDILKSNTNLREFSSPVSEDRLIAVSALRPDVAIVPVQRADARTAIRIFGETWVWRSMGRGRRARSSWSPKKSFRPK